MKVAGGTFLLCLLILICPSTCLADEASSSPLEVGFDEAFDISKTSPVYFENTGEKSFIVSEDIDAISGEGISFGITEFYRYNKGTNREYEGTYFGCRFPAGSQDSFAVVVCDSYVIVYLPKQASDAISVDITDVNFQKDFIELLQGIDEESSMGGLVQSAMSFPYYFTDEKNVKVGDRLYSFNVELEEDRYYTTVNVLGSNDGSKGVEYVESGELIDAESLAIAPPAQGIDSLGNFFSKLDIRPLWVSLKTAGVALFFIFIFGLLAAWATINASSRFKGIFDTIFTIPMVLPPTVCGFLLLMLFGTSTAAGQWLIAHGIDIVFTWPAAVIACVVVGFPLMYRTARGAFENLDSNMLDAARTLGWPEWKIFVRLMLPLAWPSIAAGTILAFARAMGEFGATLFFAGNYAGITQTIPLAIYFQWMSGNTDVALFWVVVVIAISFFIILLINLYSSRTQRYREGGHHELES